MPPPRPHAPAQARAIVREAKRGGPIEPWVDEARTVGDPYHRAWALLQLCRMQQLAPGPASAVMREALEALAAVEPPWRRGELAVTFLQAATSPQRDLPRAACDAIVDAVVALLHALPADQARAEALTAAAPHLPAARLLEVLDLALGDALTAAEPGKALLRARAASDAPAAPDLVDRLASVADPAVAARLLGYAASQARPGGAPFLPDALPRAVACARRADEAAGVEALRYLATLTDATQDLTAVAEAGAATSWGPAAEARVVAAVATRCDKLGHRAEAMRWTEHAIARAAEVGEARERGRIRANLAKGCRHLGWTERAAALEAQAAEDRAAVERPAEAVPPSRAPAAARSVAAPTADAPAPHAPRSGRAVLALHNGYKGGLAPAHVRAVARAAPLCVAFDLDLLLLSFPVDDLKAFLARFDTETKVGEGAPYVRRLADEGRLRLAPRQDEARPERWPLEGGGPVVATSPRPDAAKQVPMAALAQGPAPVLVMGLGPHGLPKELLAAAPHHLELTGQGVSLETATAMGVLVERWRAARDASEARGAASSP